MPMGSFFFSPHLNVLRRPPSPCLNNHTVLSNRKKNRWRMKWAHTWITRGASRLIVWHWQRPGGAWFRVPWSCALSVDLDFGLVCGSVSYIPHILQILAAKELKHRWINKLVDAGGGNVFCVLDLGVFSPPFPNYVTYESLNSEEVAAFQMSFGCHQEGNTGWFHEELVAGLFRNHGGVRLMLWYEILRHF